MPKSPTKKTAKAKPEHLASHTYPTNYIDLGAQERGARAMGSLLAGDLAKLHTFAITAPAFAHHLERELVGQSIYHLQSEIGFITRAIGLAIESGYALRFEMQAPGEDLVFEQRTETLDGWIDFAEAMTAGGVNPMVIGILRRSLLARERLARRAAKLGAKKAA